MNKKKLHYDYSHYLKHIKVRYFLIIAILFFIVSIFALRNNNETMISLRNQLYAADKSGQNVQQALDRLQAYVMSNMNTNLSSGDDSVYPPIQLKYSYERAVEAQSKELAKANVGLYTRAEDYCQTIIPEGTVDFLGGPRVPCIEHYVMQHGEQVTPVSPSLYEFDFVTPIWSPDLAGISMLVGGLFTLIALIIFIAKSWVKYLIR